MATRIDSIRRNALALLDEANRLEETYVEEPKFEDGTGLIQFQKQYHNFGKVYTYAAVRVNVHGGRWYISGSAAMNAREGYAWDAVLEFIQLGYEWSIWVPEGNLIEIASSETKSS